MENKRYTVVLTGKKGDALALKINPLNDEKNTLIIDVKFALKKGGGTLYLMNDEITKIEVDNDKTTYKVRFAPKSGFSCAYKTGDDLYIGSTLKTPSVAVVERRISSLEKSLATEKETEEKQNEILAQSECKTSEKVDEEISQDEREEEITALSKNDEIEVAETGEMQVENRVETIEETHEENDVKTDDGKAIEKVSRVDVNGEKAFALNDYLHYDGTNFYLAVKPQLDEIFICYPPEKDLNDLVPNSRWVKVSSDDDYYVVGLVYDQTAVAYICYGIPVSHFSPAPEEIADVAVWLPVDVQNPDGKGYWVIYQSAVDGKCVK